MNALPETHRNGRRLFIRLCLASLALALAGCSVLKQTASIPQRTVAVFVPGGKSDQPQPGALQQSLMQFADDYSLQATRSIDELVGLPESPLTPVSALNAKLSCVGGAMSIASGQNPYGNLLDMVALTTLTRMVLADYWVKTTNGAAFESWLLASRRLETNVWQIADQVLAKEQQQQLKQSIASWYAGNPNIQRTFFLRTHELATALPRSLAKQKQDGSVFDILDLDPLAGLDPAVREITETRLFAERSMYVLQRMPYLLRWQTELLLYGAGTHPQVVQALADTARLSESADRASRAVESLSRTAEKLPSQIAEARQTLVAGEQMSTALNAAITNFTVLMKLFGVGTPDNAPSATNAPPFNILDYATTADHIAAMSKELNVTIKDLNTTLDSPALDARLQAVNQVSRQASADLRGVLNHAFLLAIALVVFIFVCAWIYRAVVSKRNHPNDKS